MSARCTPSGRALPFQPLCTIPRFSPSSADSAVVVYIPSSFFIILLSSKLSLIWFCHFCFKTIDFNCVAKFKCCVYLYTVVCVTLLRANAVNPISFCVENFYWCVVSWIKLLPTDNWMVKSEKNTNKRRWKWMVRCNGNCPFHCQGLNFLRMCKF